MAEVLKNIVSMAIMKRFVSLTGVYVALLPGIALAQAAPAASASRIQEVICDLVALVQTDMGQAVGTAAILALGIQALVGRVSWGAATVIIAGIGVMLGAGEIVLAMTGIDGCGAVIPNANTP